MPKESLGQNLTWGQKLNNLSHDVKTAQNLSQLFAMAESAGIEMAWSSVEYPNQKPKNYRPATEDEFVGSLRDFLRTSSSPDEPDAEAFNNAQSAVEECLKKLAPDYNERNIVFNRTIA